MSIQIHPKGTVLYLLTLSASLAFSSFYGGPVSFAWLYAVLLLVPLSACYILACCYFLRVFQEIEVHRLVRGEDHKYRVIIENTSILPIHNMRLRTLSDRCSLYEIRDGTELSLSPHEKKQMTSGVACTYAGSYDIGIHLAEFTDPFSIFTIGLDIPYTFRAVVSPPVTDIADSLLDLENRINSTGLKSNRLPEDTPGSDLRPYRQGDPLKSVNWKVSARHSALITRIPDKMEKRTVTILMQAAYLPKEEQTLETIRKRDFFLELIVSAAWHFAKQGVPVRLIYPAGKIIESTVDSYESFMNFYSIAADGIFYYSEEDFMQMLDQAAGQRSSANDQATRILIREDPEPGEDHCVISD